MYEKTLPEKYFDFIWYRFGFAFGSYWELMHFCDGSVWSRIGLGIYWREA